MNQGNQPEPKKRNRKLSLSRMIREIPTREELNVAWDEVDRNPSHRAAAIVGAAFVEDAVRFAVSRKFVKMTDEEVAKLFDTGGPLSSFNSLIDIGYALGIYKSLMRDDLHIIRRIRNGFAHAMRPIDFDTPEIVKEVQSFQFMKWRESQPTALPFGGGAFDNPHRGTFARICRVFVHEIFMKGLTGFSTQGSTDASALFSATSFELPKDDL